MLGRPAIVDAHHHVWDFAARPQPWLASSPVLAPLRRDFLLPELIPLAATAGVTGTVVVQTVCEEAETAELLDLAESAPLVTAVVGWTDLGSPAVADAVAGLRALRGGRFLTGIRHPLLTEPDPDWLSRLEILRGLSALAAADLTFDLVLQPDQLPVAVRAAAAVPALTFVLDHLGNAEVGPRPDSAWAAALTALARLPNTACKLSGIFSLPEPAGSGHEPGANVARLRPYLDIALEAFGADRLMFGSDWPVCTLGAGYDRVVATALALTGTLSAAERAAIFAGTARAVYRIGTNGQS